MAGKPVLPVVIRYAAGGGVNCGFVWRPPLRSRLWGMLPVLLVQALRIAAAPRKEITARLSHPLPALRASLRQKKPMPCGAACKAVRAVPIRGVHPYLFSGARAGPLRPVGGGAL